MVPWLACLQGTQPYSSLATKSIDTCPLPQLAFGEEVHPGGVSGTAGVMQGGHLEDFLSRPPVRKLLLYHGPLTVLEAGF